MLTGGFVLWPVDDVQQMIDNAIGVGVVLYVVSSKLTEWQLARERAARKAAAMDPDRRAALDAKRAAAMNRRWDDAELQRQARAMREEAEAAKAKERADKIARYDNLKAGKSNKPTSGVSGWRGSGGDDAPHRPSWARRRQAPSGGGG